MVQCTFIRRLKLLLEFLGASTQIKHRRALKCISLVLFINESIFHENLHNVCKDSLLLWFVSFTSPTILRNLSSSSQSASKSKRGGNTLTLRFQHHPYIHRSSSRLLLPPHLQLLTWRAQSVSPLYCSCSRHQQEHKPYALHVEDQALFG